MTDRGGGPTSSPKGERPELPSNDDSTHAAKAAALLGAILALGALALYGPRTAFSVLVGATIAVANLLTMRAIIRALLPAPTEEEEHKGEDRPADDEGTRRGGGVAWGVFAAFKMLLLFGGIWLLLTRQLVDPMPLLIGYGVLPLGIVASALWSSLGPRR